MTVLSTERSVPKRAKNLSIDGALLDEAKALGLNLSAILEDRLRTVLCEHRRAKWLQDNQAAMDTYNRRVDAQGVFGDDIRTF